jgi:hypothetical protein
VDRYNQTARPFNWKFTATDLAAFLHRITEHDEASASPQAGMPLAA